MLISYQGNNIGFTYDPISTSPDQAKIQGVAQVNSVVGEHRLMLTDQRDGTLIRHWVTPPTGIYDFNVSVSYLGYKYLSLIIYPDDETYNAAIISNIEPTYINA
jgi:hypothetical protein